MRAGVLPPLFVLQVMDARRKPEWEEERRVPVRSRCGEDGGGAPGPSTSRLEWELVLKKTDKLSVFPCCHMLGWATR